MEGNGRIPTCWPTRGAQVTPQPERTRAGVPGGPGETAAISAGQVRKCLEFPTQAFPASPRSRPILVLELAVDS